MTTLLVRARDTFRTELWPIPAAAVVVAVVLGLGLPRLDGAVDGQLPSHVGVWLFGGDANAARSLLGTIASSLITVTSLTFSLTVVTLQLASSQYSPRLLRTFTSDLFVQATLAVFLATFTYALTVMRAVRAADGTGQHWAAPKIAVTMAFVFAVASVFALVLFLAHLSGQIRVETILRNVRRDASSTMRAVLDQRPPDGAEEAIAPQPPADRSQPLFARSSGFLTWIEQDSLLQAMLDEDASLRLDVWPGSFLVEGTPVGVAWPVQGGRLDGESAARLADRVAGCLHTSTERTRAQDVGYGLRQLVDVANKALSPSMNDPTTAIHALHHISVLLCDLADRDLGERLMRDHGGRVRLVLARPDLATYVDLGISQPRRYGAADPQVVATIFVLLRDLSYRVAPDQRRVVRDQLARLRDTVRAQPFDDHERASLEALGHQIEQNLYSPVGSDKGA